MSNIDRVLVSADWEQLFPLTTVNSPLRVGSDHSPLVVDTGDNAKVRSNVFRLESAWLNDNNFKKFVIKKWPMRQNARVLDYWQDSIRTLSKSVRRRGANLGAEKRKTKEGLLKQLEEIDGKAEQLPLTPEEWRNRYIIEEESEQIDADEELFWPKTGGEK